MCRYMLDSVNLVTKFMKANIKDATACLLECQRTSKYFYMSSAFNYKQTQHLQLTAITSVAVNLYPTQLIHRSIHSQGLGHKVSDRGNMPWAELGFT